MAINIPVGNNSCERSILVIIQFYGDQAMLGQLIAVHEIFTTILYFINTCILSFVMACKC